MMIFNFNLTFIVYINKIKNKFKKLKIDKFI